MQNSELRNTASKRRSKSAKKSLTQSPQSSQSFKKANAIATDYFFRNLPTETQL